METTLIRVRIQLVARGWMYNLKQNSRSLITPEFFKLLKRPWQFFAGNKTMYASPFLLKLRISHFLRNKPLRVVYN